MWCNLEKLLFDIMQEYLSTYASIHLYIVAPKRYSCYFFQFHSILYPQEKKCKWSNRVREGGLYKQLSLPPLKPCQGQGVQLMFKEGVVITCTCITLACLVPDKING